MNAPFMLLGDKDMFIEISEQEFLSFGNNPIVYIGIYELNWLMDDNLLDCAGIIVAFEKEKILITSKKLNEDDFDFVYYKFPEEYECRKILSSFEEPIHFIRKESEENCYRYLRFQIGNRPIFVTAYEDEWIDVGLSHWDINDEWIDFENDNLLNDRP